jgi:hypothetical protein
MKSVLSAGPLVNFTYFYFIDCEIFLEKKLVAPKEILSNYSLKKFS